MALDNPRLSDLNPSSRPNERSANIEPSIDKLVVAVTDCALFDLAPIEPNLTCKLAQARSQQHEQDHPPLAPGGAFHFISKLLKLNETAPGSVEVILLSRAGADMSLHLFQSLEHYGLAVSRAAFTTGAHLHPYLRPFGAHLFLSAESAEVRLALAQCIPAAVVLRATQRQPNDDVLRIAFDGDAVLFSDEAEYVYARFGLAAFQSNEVRHRLRPLGVGPLLPFLARLQALQACRANAPVRIRTALVTARAAPAHERVVRTLHAWDIRIDEVLFLGGMDKGLFLSSFGADLFFDDQQRNCDSAARFVPTAHVPYGVKNQITSLRQSALDAEALGAI